MPPGEKRIRTLVVDDSADFVRYLCAFLDALSNVDVIAKGRSGPDGIALAHEWMPDLVLIDVRMPDVTGLEAASQRTRELQDVVVILMSAFEDARIPKASQESGAFAFVMKEHLTQELPRLLNWHHRRRDGTILRAAGDIVLLRAVMETAFRPLILAHLAR